jgi:hypothetical protein
MAKISETSLIQDDAIMNKIYFLRGSKIMLDRDLASLQILCFSLMKRRLKSWNRKMRYHPANILVVIYAG